MSDVIGDRLYINPNRFPEVEQHAVSFCGSCLDDLASYTQDFKATLRLADFCSFQMFQITNQQVPMQPEAFGDLSSWRLIAARDGAMTIYHFAKAMDGANTWLANCPTLLSVIDRPHLGQAFKLLSKYFPNFAAVRHAVAHSSEVIKNQKSLDKNAFSGTYKSDNLNIMNVTKMTIRNTLDGRNFLNTFEGKVQSYEVSQKTLDQLIEIKSEVYAAFRPAERI